MKLRSGNPEEVGMSSERIQYATDLTQGWVEQGVTSAAVFLVARKGVIVSYEAFGYSGSQPLEPDTLFPLASLAKPLTATAIMILVEGGLLGLGRPVSHYIPEFVGEDKDLVCVHHLLTHTSGLRRPEITAHCEKNKDTVEIPPAEETQHPDVQKGLFPGYDAPLWKLPGTEMSYCNYGYGLLGEIVRRVSGKSLDDFTRERIFEPLGMKDTCFIVPDSLKNRVVKAPTDAAAPWFYGTECQEMPSAAGGAFSTLMDMSIFGQMFLNLGVYGDTRILSPTSVIEMTRNHIPGISGSFGKEIFPEGSWGLGWSIRENKKTIYDCSLASPEMFWHDGAGGVYLWADPAYEFLGCYFSVELRGETFAEKFRMDLFSDAVMAAITEV
jgi:CubicO group peptidase (beta-lactamase class C family)